MKKAAFVFLLLVCMPSLADAALVVATCGSITYTAGQVQQMTIDTNGKICT